MKAVFEVVGPIPADADRIFGAADAVLWRHEGRVHLTVRSILPVFLREAALAGLQLRPGTVTSAERPPAMVEAHGRDLRPIRCDRGTVDRIEVRPVPLADATRALLRRPIRALPAPVRRRDRCRELLHGEDVAYRAARVVWCPRAALRDAALRRSLRPVVFDHGAGAPLLERTARSGDLAVWLRG
ncbi:MAG TPA: hypothetical protein VIN34_00300 [Candidatus Limnocylindria bacterium]|jgi:hypothetical protein